MINIKKSKFKETLSIQKFLENYGVSLDDYKAAMSINIASSYATGIIQMMDKESSVIKNRMFDESFQLEHLFTLTIDWSDASVLNDIPWGKIYNDFNQIILSSCISEIPIYKTMFDIEKNVVDNLGAYNPEEMDFSCV
jgi:hypothetical protein